MKLVPIPLTDADLQLSMPHWLAFLPAIAKRSKEPITALLAKVVQKHVQPILAWDEDAKIAVAMAGIAYHRRGDDLIAEWVWMTGADRDAWTWLLPELERYLKEHVGCAVLRPVCRPGWKKFLQQRGYHETHVTLEKVL